MSSSSHMHHDILAIQRSGPARQLLEASWKHLRVTAKCARTTHHARDRVTSRRQNLSKIPANESAGPRNQNIHPAFPSE